MEEDIGGELLRALLNKDKLTNEQAMSIPAFAACVNLIAGTISMIPIRLYRRRRGEVEEVENDIRTSLLNDNTNDTLSGVEFKRALIYDYLVGGNGYAYIQKAGTRFVALNYVKEESVAVRHNADPILKDYEFLVGAKSYGKWDFLKVLRNTRNGWSGISIVEESNELLSTAYATQQLQKVLAQTGGNKKGFIQSQRHLSDPAMDALKSAWRNLYQTNSENVVVLNDGLTFQESASTSTELQLNETSQTMTKGICKLFGVPVGMLEEHPAEEDKTQFIQYCIVPILTELECALNRDLLKENEKKRLFFGSDTSNLTKGDIAKRYAAYAAGIKAGFLQIDEVRYMENRRPLGLPYIKLGLQDVWYEPESKVFYNPNMNQVGSFADAMTEEKHQEETQEPVGGEIFESRNPE
jgi:HK97 family phage portal protein